MEKNDDHQVPSLCPKRWKDLLLSTLLVFKPKGLLSQLFGNCLALGSHTTAINTFLTVPNYKAYWLF